VIPRTRAGLIKYRPVGRGSRVALVAPASPFDPAELERGIAELRRLGFDPVYDDSVFDREPILAGPPAHRAIVAGPAARRADALARVMSRGDVDAVIAIRGGYGSVETLPLLDLERLVERRTALIGYSDITSLHVCLNMHAGLATLHGPMIDGRLAGGSEKYDPRSFLTALTATAVGALEPAGLEVLNAGEANGPLVGGCLTEIAASLGTPYSFQTPPGAVLFLEDVSERPYRIRRMLTQLTQAGILSKVSALVFGQMPKCDEADGSLTARGVIAEIVGDLPCPVLFGFPSGHTTTPLISLPFGVEARVLAGAAPALIIEEAAAA
jgi:muramoyltetrapeptide carboxypeptidase